MYAKPCHNSGWLHNINGHSTVRRLNFFFFNLLSSSDLSTHPVATQYRDYKHWIFSSPITAVIRIGNLSLLLSGHNIQSLLPVCSFNYAHYDYSWNSTDHPVLWSFSTSTPQFPPFFFPSISNLKSISHTLVKTNFPVFLSFSFMLP